MICVYALGTRPPSWFRQRWPLVRRKRVVTRKENGEAQTPAGHFSNPEHAAKMLAVRIVFDFFITSENCVFQRLRFRFFHTGSYRYCVVPGHHLHIGYILQLICQLSCWHSNLERFYQCNLWCKRGLHAMFSSICLVPAIPRAWATYFIWSTKHLSANMLERFYQCKLLFRKF